MYQFPTLENGKVHLLIGRSHSETNGSVMSDLRMRFQKIGQRCLEQKVQFGVVVSSAKLMCIIMSVEILVGSQNHTVLLDSDERLGRIYDDPNIEKAKLLKELDGIKMSPEQFILTKARYSTIMDRRGAEGAKALYEAIGDSPNATVLCTTHGGSRIEPILLALLGQNTAEHRQKVANGLHDQVRLVEPGQLVSVITDASGKVESIHYLTDADWGL